MLTFGSLGIANYLFLKPFWVENLAWIFILIALTGVFFLGEWGDLLPKSLFWGTMIGIIVLLIMPGWVLFASSVLQRSLSPGSACRKVDVFKTLPKRAKRELAIVYLNFAVYTCTMTVWGIGYLRQ